MMVDRNCVSKEQDSDYYPLEDSDYEIVFTCNGCKRICRDCRLSCKICEIGSVRNWDYDSFDLCVHCFQFSFQLQNHLHPRESFYVQRVRQCQQDAPDEVIPIQTPSPNQSPKEETTEIDQNLMLDFSTDNTSIEETVQFKNLEICIFCKQPENSDNLFASCIFVEENLQFRAHFACARYSPEVYYFPRSKKWFNVCKAYKRSRGIKCASCKKSGASLGCWERKCFKTYHIPCSGYSLEALKDGAVFWCPLHNITEKKRKAYLESATKCNLCEKDFYDSPDNLFICSICKENDHNSSVVCGNCLRKNEELYLYDCQHKEFEQEKALESGSVIDRTDKALCHSLDNFIPKLLGNKKRLCANILKSSKVKFFSYGPSIDDNYSLDITSTYFDIPGKIPRWATHSGLDFPGTWIPQLVRWAILNYTQKSDLVISNFLGRGTDAIEAFLLNRNFYGFDVNSENLLSSIRNVEIIEENLLKSNKKIKITIAKPETLTSLSRTRIHNPNRRLRPTRANTYSSTTRQEIFEILLGDARNLSEYIPNGQIAKLVLSHPPYFNCISYSNNLENDLSTCKTLDIFLTEMTSVAMETDRILINDGICFLMMGDNREAKMIKPISFCILNVYLLVGFYCDQIVIKRQRGCSGTNNGAGLASRFDFLYLMHEFIFILQKSTAKNKQQLEIIEQLCRLSPSSLDCNKSQFQSITGKLRYKFGKKRSAGSIWIYSTRESLYRDIVDRFTIVGTEYIIFTEKLQKIETGEREIPVEHNCSYEQQRFKAINQNMQLFLQSKPTLSLETTSISSLILIDLVTLTCNPMIEKLNYCLTNAIERVPLKGHILIGCNDYRTKDNLFIPSCFIVWTWMQNNFESKSKQKLVLKDTVICVPKGYEKRPGSKGSSQNGPYLPIIHEYLLVYQLLEL